MSKPQLRSEPLNYFYLYGPESGVRMRAVDTKWPFAQVKQPINAVSVGGAMLQLRGEQECRIPAVVGK